MDSVSHSESAEAGAEYIETIALLQEEISRLEGELLAQVEAGQSLADASRSLDRPDEPVDPPPARELVRLGAELAARDETIALLLDQLRLVEEAESASRAEWEQLAQWVAEVEERVERQAETGTTRSEEEIADHRRQVEEARSRLEQERTAWSDQRHNLEQEIHRLQSLLARTAHHEGSGADADANTNTALSVLESENRRLRQLYQELDQTSRAGAQSLRETLESTRRELEEARRERDLVMDERNRERREFEIAIASLRSHTSRASLAAREAAASEPEPNATGDTPIALEADMRIRAFRQHLKEIHSHEAEARSRNRLSARLSRLWNRTTPK